jgi:hypothetical protein
MSPVAKTFKDVLDQIGDYRGGAIIDGAGLTNAKMWRSDDPANPYYGWENGDPRPTQRGKKWSKPAALKPTASKSELSEAEREKLMASIRAGNAADKSKPVASKPTKSFVKLNRKGNGVFAPFKK